MQEDVRTVYDEKEFSLLAHYYSNVIKQSLSRMQNRESLPVIKWEIWDGDEGAKITLVFLCRSLPYITKFTYDLLSRWMVPGKRVKIPLFFSSEFTVPSVDDRELTAIEAVMEIDSVPDLENIKRALPMLEAELRMGASSYFHASRILGVKGLSLDEKAACVQEKISRWVQRWPSYFDVDLLSQMQVFFVLSRDAFKAIRGVHHLCQIVGAFYTFSKKLSREVELDPHRRHLCLKLSPTSLQSPLGMKRVLGVFVGMNFLRPNEVFEEGHLLKAARSCLPCLSAVSGSTYVDRSLEEKAQTIYMELEKEDHSEFSIHEIKEFKKRLLEEVKGHVEHLVSPIFMPRNEEEVMRDIVTLSRQIRFVRDLPQVTLAFDHQSDASLQFTVVMVSLRRGMADLLKRVEGDLEFVPDRVKIVGRVRNKHFKEAVVLKVLLIKSPFLREDHSLDLYSARQKVIEELQKVVGEVRDYNGGMIAKQIENLKALKECLGPIALKHRFLLENFFHSLFPVEVRALLTPLVMKTLFILFLTMKEEKHALKNRFEVREEKGAVFALFGIQDHELKERIIHEVEGLNLRWPTLVFLHQHVFETTYLGYILFSEDEKMRKSFLQTLEQSLTFASC